MASASPSPQVRVGVGVFVLRSNHESPSDPSFLLGKRLNSHGHSTHALPGGHLEYSETPESCAAREVLEETDLKVIDMRFLTATNDYMPSEARHYVTLFVVCRRDREDAEPRVMEMYKCEGWEWVTCEDMKRWVGEQLEGDEGSGKVVGRRLFQPLLSLLMQRPDVSPTLI